MPASHPEPGEPLAASTSLAPTGCDQDDIIDLRAILAFLRRALPLALALGLLGFAVQGVRYLLPRPADGSCSIEVAFYFSGFQKGEYPDGSKFSPNDVDSPAVVDQAIEERIPGATTAFRQSILSSLTVEPVISDEAMRSRERMRDAGLIPPAYISNEYRLTISLSTSTPLSSSDRKGLLDAIVRDYAESIPGGVSIALRGAGAAFDAISQADWWEYQPVLDAEFSRLVGSLSQLADNAPLFRSSTSHLGFGELEVRLDIFRKTQLDYLFGLIDANGMSRNPDKAVATLHYRIQAISDELAEAQLRERAVSALLADFLNADTARVASDSMRAKFDGETASGQSSQVPVHTQLASNTSRYAFEEALAAKTRVVQLQAELIRLQEQIRRIGHYSQRNGAEKSALEATATQALNRARSQYKELVAAVRETAADYDRQQSAALVRIIRPAELNGQRTPLGFLQAAGGGLAVGIALGAGLSLLGVAIRSGNRRRP